MYFSKIPKEPLHLIPKKKNLTSPQLLYGDRVHCHLLHRSVVFIPLWRRLQRTLGGRPFVASFSLRWSVLRYSVRKSSALFSHPSSHCLSRCFASPDVTAPHCTAPRRASPRLTSHLASRPRAAPLLDLPVLDLSQNRNHLGWKLYE
ncbi:uncharacterized protein LOC110267668 [Arachis ipaensis]|uniref:uncharacterized protein LOC110267668 n=1 Tax=Arachis ipaensis TaxID=130454 RepID=UPI000A2B1C6C|nr:uncharacterized protein LOC110267668 [Arachis ipaensis]